MNRLGEHIHVLKVLFQLKLADQAEYIDKFSCHEIAMDKNMYKAVIALTRTHLHVLREVPNKVTSFQIQFNLNL